MLGAIIGDIAGSIYEWNPIKHKDFQPLLGAKAFLTDDSVLTIAVADSLVNGRSPVMAFKDWGGRFHRQLFSSATEPYGSYGNGAAMRVSPAGLLASTPEQAVALAEQVTRITHDHPEGLKGGAATSLAIYLARTGTPAPLIRTRIADTYGYDLNRTLDQIRPGYRFNETCQHTVPEALICVLDATGYEDAIRNAISLGGDSDTLAAIAGGIAEARFGIPAAIAQQGWNRLPDDMREVLEALYRQAEVPFPWIGEL